MSEVPKLTLANVITTDNQKCLHIKLHILQESQIIEPLALIDSGAQGEFVNKKWLYQHKLKPNPLKIPIKLFNVDGTPNKIKLITEYIDLSVSIRNDIVTIRFLV